MNVDIGSSEKVSLSYLAFEGATKSNRPDIKVGDLVFAKLLTASQDIEPELCRFLCKKGKLGQLPGDELLFNCSLNLISKILNLQCCLLKTIGRDIPYDISVGMNGKIRVKAKSVRAIIAIGNAILYL
ncbi:Exosome complex component RRP40 [Blattella germanica]|nr:Exosome complex component RRP40 [Blattella germanica]